MFSIRNMQQPPTETPADLNSLKAQWTAAIAKGASSDPAAREASSDAHLQKLAQAIADASVAAKDFEEAARWRDNAAWLKRNQAREAVTPRISAPIAGRELAPLNRGSRAHG